MRSMSPDTRIILKKRYNTEKFVEEMEMKREFPELSAALEVEREHLLKLTDAKIEGKKMEHNLLRGIRAVGDARGAGQD